MSVATTQTIEPVDRAIIALPGAHQLTLTGIRWAAEPSDDEFRRVDEQAQVIDRVSAWVDGDVCVEYVRREQYRRAGMTVLTLVAEYALARGKALETTHRRYKVALAFAHRARVAGNGVSWSHHDVVWAAGMAGTREGEQWLAHARDAGWSVAQLRAAMRARIAPPRSDEPELRGFFPPELQRAEDWCSGQLDRLADIGGEDARRMLEAMPCTVEFVAALSAAAGKESICKNAKLR